MLFFKKLFRGSYPLVKTFWLYYVLGSTLVLLVAEGISSMFPNAFGAFSYILLGIVQLVYSIVCLVGIWRSATNYKNAGGSTLWATLAKGYVILSIIATIAMCVFMMSI